MATRQPRPPRGAKMTRGSSNRRPVKTSSGKTGASKSSGGKSTTGASVRAASERKGLWRHLHNVPLPGEWEPHRAENGCVYFRHPSNEVTTWVDMRYPLPNFYEEQKQGLKSIFISKKAGNQVKWDPRPADVRASLEYNNLPLPPGWEPRRTQRGHVYYAQFNEEGEEIGGSWTDPRNPLPPGWSEDKTVDGLSIFVHADTGAVSHADPRAYEADPLPEGWIEKVDPNGLIYYQHTVTGHMQWLDPTEPPLPPQWGMHRDENGQTSFRYHFNGARTSTDPRTVSLLKLRALLEKKPVRGNMREYYKPVSLIDRGGFAKIHLAKWKGGKADRVIGDNDDDNDDDDDDDTGTTGAQDGKSGDGQHHSDNDVVVALKDIAFKGSKQAESFQLAVNEAVIHAALFHPHIVKLEDYAIGDKAVTLVLELCHGGTLHNVIQSRRAENNQDKVMHYMPEEMILQIFYQILLAVQYLHSNDLLHLDLKTGNVLFDRHDQVKLCDFGLACWKDRAKSFKNGHFQGTIEYCAPEVLVGSTPTTKSDVWSLGVMLYTMAALQTPWPLPDAKGKNQERAWQEAYPAMRGKICAEQYPPLPGNYSDDFHSLLKQLLSKKTRFRPEIEDVVSLPIFQRFQSQTEQ
eukprot:TRINITY_DN926_c0_g1_i1.p1 TRINITY_DN926_c0_g1~~TRINITY_DN926_c0_g1_i1.p1  ORF type:complete len:631 (-),score=91.83 TRINITY_DN926_c0_g1_i1:152-2044(-)